MKSSTTQKVIVVNTTPLDDDEADYLVSRERHRSGREVPFDKFLKRNGWKALLLSQAEKEYDALGDASRATALAVLNKLAADPLQEGSSAVGGHRGYYRTAFYRDRYRMIYKVSKSRREVVVTRIRRKDEKTYRGYEPERRVP